MTHLTIKTHTHLHYRNDYLPIFSMNYYFCIPVLFVYCEQILFGI